MSLRASSRLSPRSHGVRIRFSVPSAFIVGLSTTLVTGIRTSSERRSIRLPQSVMETMWRSWRSSRRRIIWGSSACRLLRKRRCVRILILCVSFCSLAPPQLLIGNVVYARLCVTGPYRAVPDYRPAMEKGDPLSSWIPSLHELKLP
jgi:hypothetical protein